MFHTFRRSQKELRPVEDLLCEELATVSFGCVTAVVGTTSSFSGLVSLAAAFKSSLSFLARFLLGAGASELCSVPTAPFRWFEVEGVSWTTDSGLFSLGQAFSSALSLSPRFFLRAGPSAAVFLDVGNRWRLVLEGYRVNILFFTG